jgi:hypothetical protein
MKLKDYLWAYGMTNADFGKKIRYSAIYVSNVISGVAKPGPKFIEDVEKATNGQVQAHELECRKGWLLEKKEPIYEKCEQMTFAEMENK